MQKSLQPTVKSFGEVVKAWSFERFMSTFTPIYPAADLKRLAKELGIEKPKRSAEKEADS
jgi:hypothetical protein